MPILGRAMRKLALPLCSFSALVVGSWRMGGEPTAGTLSVDRGQGVVMIDLKGSVLGRITTGSLRVTDLTPNDRYVALVIGRKLTSDRVGPRTVVYQGQGSSFPDARRRVPDGRARIGITVSAVGRGGDARRRARFTGR